MSIRKDSPIWPFSQEEESRFQRLVKNLKKANYSNAKELAQWLFSRDSLLGFSSKAKKIGDKAKKTGLDGAKLINVAGIAIEGRLIASHQDFRNKTIEELEAISKKHGFDDNTVMTGSDWRGVNWPEAKFAKTLKWKGAKLAGASFEGGDFEGADLRGVIAHDPDHPHLKVNLRGANLKEAYLDGLALKHFDLTGADLRKARLYNVDFRDAMVSGAQLEGALFGDLPVAEELAIKLLQNQELDREEIKALIDAGVKNLNFVRVKLGTDLRGLELSKKGISLEKATLSGVILSGEDLRFVNLKSAALDNAKLDAVDLRNNDVSGANFAGADLSQANCQAGTFERCILDNAILDESNFYNASFKGSSLRTNLKNSYLLKANFDGVNFAKEEPNSTLSLDAAHAETSELVNPVDLNTALTKLYSKQALKREDVEVLFKAKHYDLNGARFAPGTDLRGLNLSKNRVDLSDAILKEVNLKDEDLRGVMILRSILEGANLDGAIFKGDKELDKTIAKLLSRQKLKLDDIKQLIDGGVRDLAGANIGSDDGAIDLSFIADTDALLNLSGARLSNLKLSDAANPKDLSNLIFANAKLNNVTCDNASFQNVDLQKAIAVNCSFKNCNFEEANLESMLFKDSQITGSNLDLAANTNYYLQNQAIAREQYQNINHREINTNTYPGLITGTSFDKNLSTLGLDSNLTRDMILRRLSRGDTDFHDEVIAPGTDLSGVFNRFSKKKINFRNTTLIGVNLSNNNFSRESDFSGADLRGARLNNSNLFGVDLSKACLIDADLTNCSLEFANLEAALLNNAVLDEANFLNTNLTGACIGRTDIQELELSQAFIKNTIFTHDGPLNRSIIKFFKARELNREDIEHLLSINITNLSRSKIKANEDLRGLRLSEFKVNFDHCDMPGVNLSGENLLEVSFTGTNLEDANLTRARFTGTDFDNSLRKFLTKQELNRTDLRRLVEDLESLEPILDRTLSLNGINVEEGADLKDIFDGKEIDLSGASLPGVDLSGQDLRKIDLHGANLRDANLAKADIRGLDFSRARLKNTNFEGAKTKGAKFKGAIIINSNPKHLNFANTNAINKLTAASQVKTIVDQGLKPLMEATLSLVNQDTRLEQYRKELVDLQFKVDDLSGLDIDESANAPNIDLDAYINNVLSAVNKASSLANQINAETNGALPVENLNDANAQVTAALESRPADRGPKIETKTFLAKISKPIKLAAASFLIAFPLLAQMSKAKFVRNQLETLTQAKKEEDRSVKVANKEKIEVVGDRGGGAPRKLKQSQLDELLLRHSKTLMPLDLHGYDLRGLSFDKAEYLERVNFSGALLDGVDLSYIEMREVDFSNASLKGANLRDSIMKFVRFYKADLQNAKCENAIFHLADFQLANLTESNFSFANLATADISDAKIDKTIFSFAKIRTSKSGIPLNISMQEEVFDDVETKFTYRDRLNPSFANIRQYAAYFTDHEITANDASKKVARSELVKYIKRELDPAIEFGNKCLLKLQTAKLAEFIANYGEKHKDTPNKILLMEVLTKLIKDSPEFNFSKLSTEEKRTFNTMIKNFSGVLAEKVGSKFPVSEEESVEYLDWLQDDEDKSFKGQKYIKIFHHNPKVIKRFIDKFIANKTYIPEVNCIGSDLRAIDFHSEDIKPYLKYFNFRGSYLPEANLSGLTLNGADFSYANVNKVNFNNAKLNGAGFIRAAMILTQLQNAKLRKANLSGATMEMANFKSANLENALVKTLRKDLGNGNYGDYQTDLRGANFEDANLTNANFMKAFLVAANLKNADCKFANFAEADLRGTNYEEARNLTRTREAKIDKDPDYLAKKPREMLISSFDIAKEITEAAKAGRKMNFANCDLRGYQFPEGYVLNSANFDGADLRYTSFPQISLYGARFVGADLKNSSFKKPLLYKTNFSKARFEESKVQGGSIEQVKFKDTKLKGTEFDGTFVVNTDTSNKSANFSKAKLGLRYKGVQPFDIDDFKAMLEKANQEFGNIRASKKISLGLDMTQIRDKSIYKADFNKADLRGMLVDGKYGLRTFLDCDFDNANLANSNFYNMSFAESSMRKVDFRKAKFQDVDFEGTDIEGANFTGGDLRQIKNWPSELKKIKFAGANLAKVNWTSKNLTGSTFYGANFYKSDLQYATFNNCILAKWDDTRTIINFKSAKLTGAHFVNATVYYGDFRDNKSLSLVDFSDAKLQRARFNRADLSDAKFNNASLAEADFNGANLRGAEFVKAKMYGAQLAGVDLREGSLHDAILLNANLRGADLRGVDLRGADLRGADLTGANLEGAKLQGARIHSAIFYKANLKDAELQGVKLGPASIDIKDIDLPQHMGSPKQTSSSRRIITIKPERKEPPKDSLVEKKKFIENYPIKIKKALELRLKKNTLNFAKAILTGADLSKAVLNNADFTGSITQGIKSLKEAKLRGAKLPNANFAKMDQSSTDLADTDFQDAVLTGADFSGAKLDGNNFKKADLSDANFESAYLRNANLTNTTMAKTNFANANLGSADLSNATLDAAIFTKGQMVDAKLVGTTINKSNFVGAILNGANFRRSKITETKFDKADLRRVDFDVDNWTVNTSFKGVRFEGLKPYEKRRIIAQIVSEPAPFDSSSGNLYTILSLLSGSLLLLGSKLRRKPIELPSARESLGPAVTTKDIDYLMSLGFDDFSHAKLEPEQDLSALDLGAKDVNFSNAQMPGANLSNMQDLEKMRFIGANLQRADLSGSKLVGADFLNADLDSANLQRADLRGVNFRNSNLRRANLIGAVTEGADFTGADLANAKITGDYTADKVMVKILTKQKLSSVDLLNYFKAGFSNLRGAIITNLDLKEALKYTKRPCDMSGADLSGTDLSGVDLAGYNLMNANLSSAKIKGTKFDDANLVGAILPAKLRAYASA